MSLKLLSRCGQKSLFMLLLVVGLCSTGVYANPKGFILDIELSPAICKIDPKQKRTRQCLEGYSLAVAGLYPIKHTKPCETSSFLTLTPVQKRVLMRIMPDENIQVRLWRSIGGCIGMNAHQYFRLMVNYAERLNIAEEFSTPTTLRVNREWLEKRFIQQNTGMTEQSFKFSCKSLDSKTKVLTNLKVCYEANGRYTSCGFDDKNSCPTQFVIQGSY